MFEEKSFAKSERKQQEEASYVFTEKRQTQRELARPQNQLPEQLLSLIVLFALVFFGLLVVIAVVIVVVVVNL